MENKESQKKRPCVGCDHNDGLFCHAWTCPYETSKPEEAKAYCNHRKCKNKECKNNLANAPKGEIVPIVGFTECEQYKKFVAEADRQARKDLDQAIVDAFDDTEQFRRDAHNLD